MELQSLLNQLLVSPEYKPHLVPRDNVVVLYNRRRPLLLQGRAHVSLFQLVEQEPSRRDLPESPTQLQQLALLAVQLIAQKILVIASEPAATHPE